MPQADELKEQGIKQFMQQKYQDAAAKMHTLRGFAAGKRGLSGISLGIADPYSFPLEEYQKCAEEIQAALETIVFKDLLFESAAGEQ